MRGFLFAGRCRTGSAHHGRRDVEAEQHAAGLSSYHRTSRLSRRRAWRGTQSMNFSDLEDDSEDSPEELASRAVAASRSTWVSVVVNVLLSALQIAVGLYARSQSLIADGLHSLSDLVSDFVVLFASRHSKKGADQDHPYGHQRFETAASLVLGLLLLGVGVGMLWSAAGKLEAPDTIAEVHIAALWVAIGALVAKETLFRYMLAVAKRVKSGMLVANAWHARSDAASSLVVALGITGNLLGYPMFDPIAALIVGFMVGRMGWGFAWDALHDLMDRAVDEQEVAAIARTLTETPGVRGLHDLKTRKMGDMIVVDAHIEVDAAISVEAGHDIAVAARNRVMQRHRVLNLMTHIDPQHRPDLDHLPVSPPAASITPPG
jgi:cation diffusion facilitator family transporter